MQSLRSLFRRAKGSDNKTPTRRRGMLALWLHHVLRTPRWTFRSGTQDHAGARVLQGESEGTGGDTCFPALGKRPDVLNSITVGGSPQALGSNAEMRSTEGAQGGHLSLSMSFSSCSPSRVRGFLLPSSAAQLAVFPDAPPSEVSDEGHGNCILQLAASGRPHRI